MKLFNENQSVYEGSGSVYIDEEGMLKAKICHVFSKDESAFDNWGKAAQRALSSVPGKVLPTSFYYFFEGVDVSGRTWTANNISSVSAPLSFPSCAQIVTATLPSIVCDKSENLNNDSELKELTFAQLIIRGNYEFPWNTWVSKEYSRSLSKSEFLFKGEKCFIEEFDKKFIKIGLFVRGGISKKYY